MPQSPTNDAVLEARRKRGVRVTVAVVVTVALLIYVGVISGVMGR
ncbi:MAG TPA: hypothetical protein VFN29_13360 [Chiayiivirga sp.]|nr:hypothetical protein [Chiayiivirga sp.]